MKRLRFAWSLWLRTWPHGRQARAARKAGLSLPITSSEAFYYEALRNDPEHRDAVRLLNANLMRKARGADSP